MRAWHEALARCARGSLAGQVMACVVPGVLALVVLVELLLHEPAERGMLRWLLIGGIALATLMPMAWAIGRVLQPLRALVSDIDRHGMDMHSAALAERGARELRTLAAAFNRVRQRSVDMLADQTRMLTAISHDLRTPATRLRLRLEYVAQGTDLQNQMLRDLDEMDALLSEAMAFLGHDVRVEPHKLVDVTALLAAICDDYADVGRPVVLVEPPPLRFRSVSTLFATAGRELHFEHDRKVRLRCRPQALRRAVTNLIDNALKYGHAAEVRIDADARHVRIAVQDRGPGIAEHEQAKVLLPFYRIDASRQRATGGMGLGLAIVKSVADAHGGRIELCNVEAGGLLATLELPREPPS